MRYLYMFMDMPMAFSNAKTAAAYPFLLTAKLQYCVFKEAI